MDWDVLVGSGVVVRKVLIREEKIRQQGKNKSNWRDC